MLLGLAAGTLLAGAVTLAWPRWVAAPPRRDSREWTRSRRILAVVTVLTSGGQAAAGHVGVAGSLLGFGLGSLIGMELATRWQERDARHQEG
ncbi:MAG: hypothetical protein KC489_00540 [Gemmatimonadetes bacterium]|nr:hypothetical protein [Gemmatimonadota bacterium]